MNSSQEIHDMIQAFPLEGAACTPELTASKILDILDALNRRMDAIEAGGAGAGGKRRELPGERIKPD